MEYADSAYIKNIRRDSSLTERTRPHNRKSLFLRLH